MASPVPVRPSVTCVVVVVVVSGQEANRKRVAKRSRGLYGRNCRRVAYAFVRVFLTRYRLPRIATVETVVVFFFVLRLRANKKQTYIRPSVREEIRREAVRGMRSLVTRADARPSGQRPNRAAVECRSYATSDSCDNRYLSPTRGFPSYLGDHPVRPQSTETPFDQASPGPDKTTEF